MHVRAQDKTEKEGRGLATHPAQEERKEDEEKEVREEQSRKGKEDPFKKI